MNRIAGIIFSDIDGTFLDDRYRPALDADGLARVARHWRVVWTTSRTSQEVSALREALRHTDDAIVENGGVCLSGSSDVAGAIGRAHAEHGEWVVELAAPLEETRTLVERVFSSVGRRPRSLEDLSLVELARRSGYGVDDALRARTRRTTLMLMNVDQRDPHSRHAFDLLRQEGCTVAQGGHWVNVLKGSDKASAARRWLNAVGWKGPTVGIGNAANDCTLLAGTTLAFAIRNAAGHDPSLSRIPGVHLLERPGTEGWMEMIDVLNARFGFPNS